MQKLNSGATIKAQDIISWVLEISGLWNTQYVDEKLVTNLEHFYI